MSAAEPICHQIRVRNGQLEEWNSDGPVVRIPVKDVVAASIVRARLAERPVAQAIAGLVMVALGVFFSIRVALWLWGGGTIYDVEILMVGWLAGGVLVGLGALRRGIALIARTSTTTRKLRVGKATREELLAFAAQVRALHSLEIAVDIARE